MKDNQSRFWYGLNQYLPPLGFGGWQLAGPHQINGKENGWGEIREDIAIELISAALTAGIKFFDTAQGYGDGRSEKLTGLALSRHTMGNEAIICTKISVPDISLYCSNELENWLRSTIDVSRKRLRRDVIDIVLLHNPPDYLEIYQLGDLFERLIAERIIRTYGVSAKTLDGARRFVEAKFGSCIQWNYNLLERRPEKQLFPFLAKNKVNFIARAPLFRGLLTEQFIKTDGANHFSDVRSNLDESLLQWVHSNALLINEEAKQYRVNISEYALSFALSHPCVSCVIPGLKNSAQLQSAVNASALAADIEFNTAFTASSE